MGHHSVLGIPPQAAIIEQDLSPTRIQGRAILSTDTGTSASSTTTTLDPCIADSSLPQCEKPASAGSKLPVILGAWYV